MLVLTGFLQIQQQQNATYSKLLVKTLSVKLIKVNNEQ